MISKMNLTTQISGQHLGKKYTIPFQIYSQMKNPRISAIYEQDEKLNEKIPRNFLESNSDKWWNDMELIL